MINQLRRPKYEGQEMVIVEPPHAMGASRLQLVRVLQRAHEIEVGCEDAQNDGRVVGLGDEAEPREAVEEGGEVGLVPRPIVDAGSVAEGVEEVRCELDLGAREVRGGGRGGRDPRDQLAGGVGELLVPEAESRVAVPGAVRKGRGGSDERGESRDDVEKRSDGGGWRGR